jgi:hypothetical protein
VLRRRVVSNLGAVCETEQGAIDGLDGSDAGASSLKRLPELAGIAAEGRDDAQAGDCDAELHLKR